jgi:hypothetical protein
LKIQTQYLQIWLAAHYSQTTVAQLNIFTVAEIDEIIKHHNGRAIDNGTVHIGERTTISIQVASVHTLTLQREIQQAAHSATRQKG